MRVKPMLIKLLYLSIFLLVFFLPSAWLISANPVSEGLLLLKDYARAHVILCLLPAFFIAGGISVFLRREAVMRYLGVRAKKVVAYSVAAVSGGILAVCSCTVLPIFAGIYKRGAGIGPATTFLYSGPAINILAIVLTANVLGMELGLARAVGAIVFSVVIGLLMHLIYRSDEEKRVEADSFVFGEEEDGFPMSRAVSTILVTAGILVFANWSNSDESCVWGVILSIKWILVSVLSAAALLAGVFWYGVRWWKILTLASIALILYFFFPAKPLLVFGIGAVGFATALFTTKGLSEEWADSTWGFAKQILPLLFIGVFVAGILLGRQGEEGLIPSSWIASSVGGNSLGSNLFASIAGAFMYFATLTEIPILQGLIGLGMGKGPALALLLAGPALSLPNMLVIRSVLGTKKTITFILLVITMATASGMIFGAVAG